ncbi:permease [Massilia sp. Root351]|uniref:hypothetical protein n=1 Tax=Massilia sp. Root351 TaxID=1736522 RepID=UPI0007089DBA|nr:hypothetical protein [Massilia sp. Root351]KQV90314.1 permease [Massilia sp. Root351]
MQRALSFEHNPSLSLPLRFLLCAPLFAALAAAVLLWHGEAAFASRWTPGMLAATHLLTLGCVSMAIIGALLQLLPAVAGIGLPQSRGRTVHAGLCAGTLLLAAGFLSAQPVLFALAMALLLPSLLLMLARCAAGLWQHHAAGASAMMAAIRVALAALAVTAVLGALLGSQFAWPGSAALPLLPLTDLHAMWGMLGWAGLTVIGVAYQVVPMFQVTETYPDWLTRGLTTWLFLLLVAVSIASRLDEAPARHFTQAGMALGAAGYGAFAAVTIALLLRRKRPRPEPATLFWYTSVGSLLAACVLVLLPWDTAGAGLPLALGALLLAGFALSVINGMLYQIVPFLLWYHLQSTLPGGCRSVPGVRKIIPEAWAQRQFGLHLAALALLLAACRRPDLLARPAAGMMLASCLALMFNLGYALRLYWRLRGAMPEGALAA